MKRFKTLASGPSLNTDRSAAGCGVLNWMNPQSNQMEKIVVAAGGSDGAPLSITELLYVDRIGGYSWIVGPSLPEKISHATMVEFHNSVILIGGHASGTDYSEDLYQLSSPGANVKNFFHGIAATARKLQCLSYFPSWSKIASYLTKGQPVLFTIIKIR